MSPLSSRIGAALLVAVTMAPAYATAQKSMSDQEIASIMGLWQKRCRDYAVGESQPSLEKRCVNMVLGDVADVDRLQQDSTVTDEMWNLCKIESGFTRTQDFHEWAACMRVAKTRPWLRAQ
jgi:hypothetical protein